MVDQVLVAERDADHALHHHRRHAVFHQIRHAPIVKTGGEPLRQVNGSISGSQQQRPGVGRDRTTIKRRDHAASVDGCKIK